MRRNIYVDIDIYHVARFTGTSVGFTIVMIWTTLTLPGHIFFNMIRLSHHFEITTLMAVLAAFLLPCGFSQGFGRWLAVAVR